MNQTVNLMTLSIFGAVTFIFLLFFYMYIAYKREKSDLYFSLMFLASSFYILGEHMIFNLTDPTWVLFWQKFENLGPLALTIIFPLAMHEYLGIKGRKQLILFLSIPVFLLALLLFPTDLVISNSKKLYSGLFEQFREGPLYIFLTLFSSFTLFYGSIILFFTVLKRKDKNSTPLLIGTLIAVATGLFDLARVYVHVNLPVTSTFVFGIAVMNIFYAYTLMRRFIRMHKALEEDEKHIKILNNLIKKDITDLLRFVVTMIDKRDTYTGEHSKKVYEYSIRLGMALNIDEMEMSELKSASILHDIGKLGVSDSILMKPGKLTETEFEKIKLHPQIGAEILDKIADLKRIVDHVKHHHERIDGTGYPDGLRGEEISQVARIISVADTYDALTSNRPYREGMSTAKALQIMDEVKGTQLDARLVDLFSQIVRQTA